MLRAGIAHPRRTGGRSSGCRGIGLAAQDTAELSFTDARVPVANLLGQEGGGFAGLTHNLAQERLSCAVSAVAQCVAALDWTVEHVRSRKAFGSPIGALQNTRFRLAELVTARSTAHRLVTRANNIQDSRCSVEAVDRPSMIAGSGGMVGHTEGGGAAPWRRTARRRAGPGRR